MTISSPLLIAVFEKMRRAYCYGYGGVEGGSARVVPQDLMGFGLIPSTANPGSSFFLSLLIVTLYQGWRSRHGRPNAGAARRGHRGDHCVAR